MLESHHRPAFHCYYIQSLHCHWASDSDNLSTQKHYNNTSIFNIYRIFRVIRLFTKHWTFSNVKFKVIYRDAVKTTWVLNKLSSIVYNLIVSCHLKLFMFKNYLTQDLFLFAIKLVLSEVVNLFVLVHENCFYLVEIFVFILSMTLTY